MTSAATHPPLKVVLIEDSHLLQEALGALLGDLERVEVVGARRTNRAPWSCFSVCGPT